MEQMQQQWLGQPAYASNAVKTGMMRQGGQGDGNITRQGDGNTIRQGDSDTTRHWGNENDMVSQQANRTQWFPISLDSLIPYSMLISRPCNIIFDV
jgi:hypothetical protein